MKNCLHLSLAFVGFMTSVGASADTGASEAMSLATTDCEAVVTQTVAELRVGAKAWWSDDVEKMAGMAAMSACFKVLSAQSTNSSGGPEDAMSAASSSSDAETRHGSSQGLSFRPLSGSASKKPYERARARKDPK